MEVYFSHYSGSHPPCTYVLCRSWVNFCSTLTHGKRTIFAIVTSARHLAYHSCGRNSSLYNANHHPTQDRCLPPNKYCQACGAGRTSPVDDRCVRTLLRRSSFHIVLLGATEGEHLSSLFSIAAASMMSVFIAEDSPSRRRTVCVNHAGLMSHTPTHGLAFHSSLVTKPPCSIVKDVNPISQLPHLAQ